LGKPEFKAKLGIFSQNLKPEDLNSILGIHCDKGYLKGDLRGPIIREKENGWIIYSRIPKYAPLKEHINDILARVSQVTDKIRDLADKPDVKMEFGCTIHADESPPLDFDKEIVAALCQIGARIDVDLYYWTNESLDEET
jgi:hypothetical protein